MQHLKDYFYLVLIAAGISFSAYLYIHSDSSYCRALVLEDLRATAAYTQELQETVGTVDFLTHLSKGN